MRALTNLAGSLRKGGGGQQTRVGAVRSLLSSYLQQVCGCGMCVCGGGGERARIGLVRMGGVSLNARGGRDFIVDPLPRLPSFPPSSYSTLLLNTAFCSSATLPLLTRRSSLSPLMYNCRP